jgi:Protein of unknown function (DUF3052)
MSAGYSGTPLPKKLGFKPGMRVHFHAPPPQLPELLGELPEGTTELTRPAAPLDLVLLFVTERKELAKRLATLQEPLDPAGMLWVCWPKRASGVPTDITEDVVREVALPRGLVDTKVAAVDATWSGLRLVIRRELR